MNEGKPKDERIRLEVGDYRAVAPLGSRGGNGRYYVNGGIIVEKRSKTALGEDSWVHVGTVNKPPMPEATTDPLERQARELSLALWRLLGQGEDK